MIIDVISLFPDMLKAALPYGIVRRSLESERLQVRVHDLRQWGIGPHRQLDDRPFGGGGGMVLMPGPLFDAVEAVEAMQPAARTRRLLLSPSGRRCRQEDLEELAGESRLMLLCGRYEGVDERVRQHLADEELSIGDYVLSGGELPALVLVEGIARLLPGALGDANGARQDSFASGLLDWPAWTRPATFRQLPVPEVLLSGDHQRIAKWRADRSLELTARCRPDLLQECGEGLESGENEPRLTHGRART